MTTRTSTRIRKTPIRFEDEVFAPGANNKFTVGRTVDVGHSSEVEHDISHVGDFHEVDREFIAEESVDNMSEHVKSEASDSDSEGESEGEWDSDEESESEGEWDSDEEEDEDEDEEEGERGYWESADHPLPENTYIYNLRDEMYSYSSYVKKINGEYIVTLSKWLDECPENIYNKHEWNGNKVGKLKNVVIPENRQQEYIEGDFVFEKGWRNIQLPMGIVENEDNE